MFKIGDYVKIISRGINVKEGCAGKITRVSMDANEYTYFSVFFNDDGTTREYIPQQLKLIPNPFELWK